MRLAATLMVLLGARGALADNDAISRKLTSFETDARAIATDLPRPNQITNAAGQRRLVDAEVAFSLGDYDAAALVLFDIAGKPGPDKDTATYYLAESLYQKGDRGAARPYFQDIVSAGNPSTKYYQPALQRLVEIAIVQHDNAGADEAMAALTGINAGIRLPSVPYIRGKYAFSQDKYDDAIAAFNEVPKGSDNELQALYFSAACQVAKKDLAKATEMFADLINRKARTNTDRRVIELGQLALGRIYYEREEPSKSIDSYLLVDRHSDLFRDALYEVAWVYVKGKQYDKALRALELLEQSDPQSTKTPTVKILEGNLRIRKAQMIRQSQINGTIGNGEASDPAVEYDKAAQLFTETHDQYLPSYQALSQMVDGTLDPAAFIEQIAGRSAHVFQAAAPIPEAAAQWLRDEPEVQRIVSVERDLGDTKSDIETSEEIIGRLEGVLAAGDRTTVYPLLASRRARIASMQDDLIKIRNDLADQELQLVAPSGDLMQLSGTRKQLADQYAKLGDPEVAYTERVANADKAFDKIDHDAAEIDGVIGSTQAMSTALRKYANDMARTATPVPADVKTMLDQTLDAATKEAQAIEDEIAQVHREVALGKDLAGVGDEGIAAARDLRKKLKAAQDAEHRVLAGFASASRDRNRSQELAALGDRAARLADSLEQTDTTIDQMVGVGLDEVRATLIAERANLVDYKAQLADYETEARTVGGTVLGASFKDVKAKFYDVVVRSDVGNVDVAWSQKEDSDDDLKRLNLARARELKQLKDEFREVLDETTPKPSAPKHSELPPQSPEGPSTSPDKQTGKGDGRVKATDGTTTGPTQPTVQPVDPKAPKKAGSK